MTKFEIEYGGSLGNLLLQRWVCYIFQPLRGSFAKYRVNMNIFFCNEDKKYHTNLYFKSVINLGQIKMAAFTAPLFSQGFQRCFNSNLFQMI